MEKLFLKNKKAVQQRITSRISKTESDKRETRKVAEEDRILPRSNLQCCAERSTPMLLHIIKRTHSSVTHFHLNYEDLNFSKEGESHH